jgi:hypothetical protein
MSRERVDVLLDRGDGVTRRTVAVATRRDEPDPNVSY